jgi:sugar phosphate isomerase/epimerase
MREYGLQMYSVRDAAEKNYEEALRAVAEMGYAKIETAGFFGQTAENFAAMLRHYGVTACSTHTGLKALEEDFAGTVAYHKAIGCYDLIIPGMSQSTREKFEVSLAQINRFQPMLEAEGIRLHYHNHFQEFRPNDDGVIVMEELAERSNVLFEIDTFWAFDAGKDPLAVLEQYRDRIRFIHLKDGLAQDFSKEGSHAIGKSLGMGAAPVRQVRDKAIEMGATIVVESEGLEPTGLEEVKRCIDYLRSID